MYNETIKRINEPQSYNRKSFKQVNGGNRYASQVVERLYHEICTELPSFKREINPADVLLPLFVQPNKTNDRILKQDGAFIISGLSRDKIEAESKLDALVRLEIEVDNKNQILKELDFICINEASLFPEVDRVANYLRETLVTNSNFPHQ